MKEIELLVRVNETKESALKKMQHLKSLGKKSILDIYLFEKSTGRFVIKKGEPSEALRLRKISGKSLLTYKNDIYGENGIWLYSEEEETDIADAGEMLTVLKKLGYAELARLENERHIFISGDYEVVLEDVKDLGLFIEVEILTEKDVDVVKIKQEMANFLQRLGLHVSDELNQGKLELMLEKQSSD